MDTDNTGCKRPVEDLQDESERKYKELIQHLPVGIYEADIRSGRLLSVNDAICRVLGYSRDELLQMSPFDLLDEASKAKFEKRIRQWQSGVEPERNVEFTIITKDGRESQAEFDVSFTRDEEGNPDRAIVFARDITERKRAEAALRESETRYRGVVQNTSAIILRVDLQGIIRFANRRALEFFGCSENELVGKPALGTIIPELETSGRDLSAMIKEITADPDRFHDNANENMRKNGERVWMEWTNSGIYDGEGRLREFLAVGFDATERRKAEEALQQSEAQARMLAGELEKKNKLVTDFFINISHEFKTPMAILMLGLELLETKAKRMDGGEAFVGNLAAMKQNSYRLNRLVANLLDITKLDAGFMQPKWEDADIAALLRNLARYVKPYARQRQLTLVYDCVPAKIPFTTDCFMLERIVLNLLSNAIKHTPAGGRITIACRAKGDGDFVCLSVADTGEGIPDDKKAIIFDRFSQVDTRMTRTSEGTGIGLALTKSLVELLGGKISVESTPGAGSTFTAELPYVSRAAVNTAAVQGSIQMDKRVQMEFSDIIGDA